MGEEDEDPDWLTAFQAPSTAPVMLSSGSDASSEASPTRTTPSREQGNGEKQASSDYAGDRDDSEQNKGKTLTFARRKSLSSKKDSFGKHAEGRTADEKQHNTSRSTPKKYMVTLSSGSDASPGNSPSRADDANHEENSLSTPKRKGVQQTKNKKPKVAGTKSDPDQIGDTLENQEGVAEDEMQDKLTGNHASQRLPLIFPDKVQRSKALIECDGDSIDLSGDIGAVGRIVVSNGPTGSQDLLLDLKGTIYKATIVPSRTFCVVSVGQSEAKIEAIMNDFIQLEPQSNLFEAETMMEGTLDGFTFDSDEEGDKLPESQAYQNDQNNEDDGLPKAKTKRKAEKQVGKAPKKAKVAGKAPKKGVRKTQPAKRTRKAKK
ncbi:DNA-binding protein BIN4 isoform X1 [Panicum miliaceum]|uniref:DNA-binding protein BIN4 isoform X1 n=1 Tax=Panicum miliaceum TaxID=4540 RepID=A0A3L6RTJ8_PANMI|nr:DNA-binding protein BIN4 isoform X1 [Panicum miliaceum]